MPDARKPKLAVWKFASCDGCQLSLLDCEDELLAVAGAIEIAYFPEATRAVVRGPYDVSLVEGSVTTPHDAERLHTVRRQSRTLITIGAFSLLVFLFFLFTRFLPIIPVWEVIEAQQEEELKHEGTGMVVTRGTGE